MKKRVLTALIAGLTLFGSSIAAVVAADARLTGHGTRADGSSLTVAARGNETSANGNAIFVDGGSNSRLMIDVTSILIVDGEAFVIGVVRNSTGDYSVVAAGTQASFTVIDGGNEGDAFQRPSAFPVSADKVLPIVSGNFVVRGP